MQVSPARTIAGNFGPGALCLEGDELRSVFFLFFGMIEDSSVYRGLSHCLSNSKHGATTSQLISSAHPVVFVPRLAVCRLDLVSLSYAVNAFKSRPSPWCLGRSASRFCGHAWCTRICDCGASMVLCRAGNGVTRHTVVSQMCCAVHLHTFNIPCSIPNMFVLGVRGVVFDASMRWLVRLRCVKVEHGSVRVYRGRAAPALFAQIS